MHRIGRGSKVLVALVGALLLIALAARLLSRGPASVERRAEEAQAAGREQPAITSAPPRAGETHAMDYDSLEYFAIYGGMPQAAAWLNLKADGEASLRFDGNGDSPMHDSPLFPKHGPVKQAGKVSAEQGRAIAAALASANLTESIGLQPTAGPIASGRVTIVRAGTSLSVEFPLYEPTARFQPLRDALGSAIAALVTAP